MHKYKRRAWDIALVGKSTCSASMRTWVHTPNTHVKPGITMYAFNKKVWRTCSTATWDYKAKFWLSERPNLRAIKLKMVAKETYICLCLPDAWDLTHTHTPTHSHLCTIHRYTIYTRKREEDTYTSTLPQTPKDSPGKSHKHTKCLTLEEPPPHTLRHIHTCTCTYVYIHMHTYTYLWYNVWCLC